MSFLRPEDKPAIWLNKERMEKYRPEMKKYYYDPTKYKNYLEQLGIKYPTTEKPATENQASGNQGIENACREVVSGCRGCSCVTVSSAVAGAIVAAVASAAQAAATARLPNPQLDQYKRNVGMEVDAMGENIQKMNDMVFSFAEPGFQEFETSKYLVGILKQNGFTVQEGVAGIPTAFVARWGSGKPVIALGSDIDDIPQASQKPGVAWHEPIVEGAPGHGEGHNGGMPLQIAAALAVKKVMEQQHLQGTLMLWPGVAEELDGSKAYYVRDGLFKDVDISIFAHVGDNLDVSWGDNANQTGLVSVQYNFTGESAHAAAAPWRGKSALDAVELMDIGWNFRREHLRLQQRSHYVIPNGGDQPNVVPPNASVWYYFREVSYPEIKRMWEIGDKMAQAATMMTDTTGDAARCSARRGPATSTRPSPKSMHANIEKVGLPQWSEADQALAHALQHELKVPEVGLATKIPPLRGREVIPDEEKRGGGSDDIGDISWNVPTVVAALSVEHGRPVPATTGRTRSRWRRRSRTRAFRPAPRSSRSR